MTQHLSSLPPLPARTGPSARLAQATALLRDGHATGAEAIFRDMIAEQPGDWVALSNLGVALDAQQRFVEAAETYQAVLGYLPDHVVARFNLAAALLKLGDIAAALPHLHAVAAHPQASPQLRARAIDARLGASAQVHGAAPNVDEPALLAEALTLRSRGLRDAALDRLRTLLRVQPDHGPAADHAGRECYWSGQLEEAQAHLAVALRWRAASWQPAPTRPADNKFDLAAARVALFDLLDALDPAAPFLASGTALGCARDGNFISFDSDIDVGVLPGTAPEGLIEALDAHPRLTMTQHDVYRDQVIRLRFVASNGVQGDVFLFQHDADGLWCGVQRGPHAMRWRETPFGLAQAAFLGRKVLLPDPVERYLEDNYGDWQVPDPGFIPGFSAPNLIDPAGPMAHATVYFAILGAMERGDAALVARYCRQAAARFPDDALLAEIHRKRPAMS